MTLTELGCYLESSKFTGHTYLPIYEEILSKWRDKPITLLELGVCDGNSMILWIMYFSKAEVHGIDSAVWQSWHKRLHLHACDCASPKVGTLFPPESLDVIIDDASHVPEQQRRSFEYLWPALKPGGYYFVEDVKPSEPDDLIFWQQHPNCRVWKNHKDGFGNYRDDDVLIMLRK